MNRSRISFVLCYSVLIGNGCATGAPGIAGVPCVVSDSMFITPDLAEYSDWYGKHLVAAGERNLCEYGAEGAEEVYRFTWLRSFHAPIMVRIQRDGAVYRGYATRLSGAGGYEPGDIDISREFEVSAGDWRRLQMLLDNAGFWFASASDEDPSVVGLDGAQWIIEGTRSGTYRALDRWTPPKRSPVRRLGEHFLAIAQLTPQDAGAIY